MSDQIFSLEDNEYQRDINPIGQYVDQASVFLSKKTGDDVATCREFITHLIKTKSANIKNPQVEYLERNEVGDREIKHSSLSSYIGTTIQKNRIFAPTLTTYLHPSEKESVLVGYVLDNIAGRQKAKKEMFAFKTEGNAFMYAFKNGEQTNKKLSNNALSGAHVSAGTPLTNKTAHSTLTSVTRTTTSYGNANNEKIVAGNRHYWSPRIVFNNITSIISNTDLNRISQICDKYQLKYPSPQDAFDCISYSTQHYWNNPIEDNRIKAYLEKLTPVELAAFVYVGDLYHIRKHNPEFIRIFIKELSERVETHIENPLDLIKQLDESELNLAHQVCEKETKGNGKKYAEMDKKGILTPIVATTQHIHEVLLQYKDFIQAFFTTKNLPASVAYFPTSLRHTALTSDTDSTIFTVQEWVEWYFGEILVSSEAIAVAAAVVFFASQSIVHILAIISANFGYDRRFLHELTMKNEFRFDVFVPTQVAKHYYASIGCQEGNVFEEYDEEIKGVHLKNSNTPEILRKKADKMFTEIMQTVIHNEKLSMVHYLNEVKEIEESIAASLRSSETIFYRFSKIKTPEAYSGPKHQSPYFHHMLWMEVFSSTYGVMQEPPYDTVKIPTVLSNKTSVELWINQMEDRDLAERMRVFLMKHGKTSLNTMYVSKSFVRSNGIPKEILSVIDIRKITQDLCITFYLILETLGYYKKANRLVSELVR